MLLLLLYSVLLYHCYYDDGHVAMRRATVLAVRCTGTMWLEAPRLHGCQRCSGRGCSAVFVTIPSAADGGETDSACHVPPLYCFLLPHNLTLPWGATSKASRAWLCCLAVLSISRMYCSDQLQSGNPSKDMQDDHALSKQLMACPGTVASVVSTPWNVARILQQEGRAPKHCIARDDGQEIRPGSW